MKEETMNIGSMHQTLGGKFKISVVDAKTDEIVWEQPEWQKNLILNNGMNQLVNTYYVNMMDYGIVGTGTRVNSVYGNSGSVSRAGNIITLATDPSFVSFTSSLGGYTQMLEVGDAIVFDTGSGGVTSVLVTGGIGNTTCTVNQSVSIPSTPFTIWKTSQSGLQSEAKRSNTQLINNLVYCGSTFVGNVLTNMRTWDFTAETSSVNYTEVGIGWASNGPSNTFSRLLLPLPVYVDNQQKIRLSYQLQVTVQPTSASARPDAFINGWTVNSPSGSTTMASESIQLCMGTGPDGNGNYGSPMMTYVSNNGNGSGFGVLEPASNGGTIGFWISPNSQSLSGFNSCIDRNANSTTAGSGDGGTGTYHNSYVANSFTLTKTATFGLYGANRNDLSSMGFGYGTPPYNPPATAGRQAFAVVFNKPQTKYNTQTLTVSYTWTWDRSFVA